LFFLEAEASVNTPITYIPNFIAKPDAAFAALWADLAWERRGKTPRREYYANDVAVPYVYGKGAGEREYLPQTWHPVMRDMQAQLEEFSKTRFEVCFLNGYEDQSDFLGYHADDSPEMDDARPIAIISLGAEREIWFRPQEDKLAVEKLKLQHGSLCLMHPGMQDTHFHRIPKAGFVCGERISLTYRGYVSPVAAG
jgi:alkylated DNA repair dioxygenase AlkB